MPLVKSGSREAISQNIHEMVASGHSRRQAVAAALRTADQYGKRAAGGRAAGGSSPPSAPMYQTASPNLNANGFVPTPQGGDYTLDQTTGGLSPHTQQLLQSFAMRGLSGPPAPAVNAPDNGSAAAALAFRQAQEQAGTAGSSGARRGGRLATGGSPPMTPWYTRREATEAVHAPAGLVHTAGPGRTDNVPMSVAAGSHVIPADVVAGLGQGNTLAGAHALGMAMQSGPGGIRLPKGPHTGSIPKPPHLAHGGPVYEGHAIKVARGGAAHGVKCIVAGGEWILSPDEVQRIEHAGKKGHEAVDHWILERRKGDVKKLKSLPGPVGSKA